MGYFDALTSSSFRTTPGGSRLFFPWGVLGRGYIIGSESEYKRLRSQIKTYLVAGMTVITVAGLGGITLQEYLVGFGAAAVWVVFYTAFYVAWLPYLLRNLQPSPEKLSLQESVALQAREQSLVLLWLVEIASIGFVAGGIFIIVVDPRQWLTAIGGILFFGFGAGWMAIMLTTRRRTSQGRR